MSPLDRLERFFLRVVTHPTGVDEGVRAATAEGLLPHGARRLEDVIPGNDRLSALEQLHIYGFAYFDRIVEVLAGEMPAVQHLLGERVFAEAMKRYLAEHPSSTWTLDRVGAAAPQWLAEQGEEDGTLWRVAADVAAVQQAMDAVWNEPFEDPVPYARLAAVPMEEWAGARVQLIPAVRLLALSYPVTEVMNAARDQGEVVLPAAAPSWMCVYRDDTARWRFALDRPQFVLLSALARGNSLADALAEVLELADVQPAQLLGDLGGWFERWFGNGLVSAVHITPEGAPPPAP
ncbi:MAG: putative DNA-binding domain-containing protein [Deltaproteobacteria bacterium]|nr:putative DNA-binding domain-containing protein [Deltaproteobacteria bacterium]